MKDFKYTLRENKPMAKSSFDKTQEAKYEGIFPLKYFINDRKVDFNLNKETPWVLSCLKQLIGHLDIDDQTQALEESRLELNFSLTKKYKHEYGDVLILQGELELSFTTYCVKSLQTMNESLSLPINCCFLHQSYQEKEEFADIIEIFVDGNIFELFFYNDLSVDVKACIDEIIEVNKSPYPTKVDETSHEIHNQPPTTTKQ
ncbi:hypothetical protein N9N67_01540 [Bacteriovoracaceae bacterium]|nr:hypothetical protein [Bacteriovoracaceae bacterium]